MNRSSLADQARSLHCPAPQPATPMSLSEFDLIRRYFQRPAACREDVVLGLGDDAAIVDVPPGMQLVAAVDTLVERVHFRHVDRPEDIGWKALAVNLSDLSAMAAEPCWYTLSLTLPNVDEAWLDGFARGLFELADCHGLALIGGDTTRGPLTVCIQILGLVERGKALTRAAARPGDLIYVSGTLGDAAGALEHGYQPDLARRLHRPEPRIELGRRLRGLAHACIDISDGLLADLGHIAEASACAAHVASARLPLSMALNAVCTPAQALRYACSGGDDYELCFTLPPARVSRLAEIAAELGLALTCIGEMHKGAGLLLDGEAASGCASGPGGYRHF